MGLPPFFGSQAPREATTCSDPWQQVYVELQGSVLPCCFWGEHVGDLKKGDELDALWNGPFYRELRRGMAQGDPLPSCKSCVRYAGYNVDSVLAHVTNRPRARATLLEEIRRRGLPVSADAAELIERPGAPGRPA